MENSKNLLSSRIINFAENKEDLICAICLDIVWEPQNCEECEALFCEYCISKWLDSNSNCPTCNSYYISQRLPRIVKNILSRLKIYCKYLENGCNKEIFYENIIIHEKECDYQIVICNNKDCNFQDKLFNYKKHKEICPFENLNCQWCKDNFKRFEIEDHEKLCDLKLVKCKNDECTFQLYLKDCQFHEEEYCVYKLIPCRFCNKYIKKMMISAHENECDERFLFCTGCWKQMKKIKMIEHEQICELIQVECDVCENIMTRKDKLNHQESVCFKDALMLMKKNKKISESNFYFPPSNKQSLIVEGNSELSELKKELKKAYSLIGVLVNEVRVLKFHNNFDNFKKNNVNVLPFSLDQKSTILPCKKNLSLSSFSLISSYSLVKNFENIEEGPNIYCMLALNEDFIVFGDEFSNISIFQISTNQIKIVRNVPESLEVKCFCLFSSGDKNIEQIRDVNLFQNLNNLISFNGYWLISGHGSGEIVVWDIEISNHEIFLIKGSSFKPRSNKVKIQFII